MAEISEKSAAAWADVREKYARQLTLDALEIAEVAFIEGCNAGQSMALKVCRTSLERATEELNYFLQKYPLE